MALADFDANTAHSFGFEFDGIVIKAIQEVSGLKMEQDVIELKQNTPDGKYVIKKLPGREKAPPDLTLTRALTGDSTFEEWVKKSRFGQMDQARLGGSIICYDPQGEPLKRYKLTNAWPKSLEIGSLKAGDTNVLTEKLTITCESIEPEAG
jgi:phage tail-like protein